MFRKVNFGVMDGGVNNVMPPSRIAKNQWEKLENFHYVKNSKLPETREGTRFLASFSPDFPVAVFGLRLSAAYEMVITLIPGGSPDETRFWGRPYGSGAFTDRGSLAFQSADYFGTVFDNRWIFTSWVSGSTPMIWAGTGNVAALGGSPAAPMTDICAWNNRLFGIYTTNPWRIDWSALGLYDDWTEVDPVIGAGFIELLSGGHCRRLVPHRERLIVMQEESLHQIITALPNTDPNGWRVELITNKGGLTASHSVQPFLNDLLFMVEGWGVVSLAAVEQFGDFEAASISKDIDFGGAGGWSAVCGDKYLLGGGDDELIWVLDYPAPNQARWSTYRFGINRAGVEGYELIATMNNSLEQKAIFAFNNGGAGAFHLAEWPNFEVDDDRFVDHVGGPDGTATYRAIARTRALSGDGELMVKDVAFQARRLSETVFNELGGTGADGELTLNVDFNENETERTTFNFSEPAGSAIVDHNARVRVWGDEGRRCEALQAEISHNEKSVGMQIKGIEATVDDAGDVYETTLEQT